MKAIYNIRLASLTALLATSAQAQESLLDGETATSGATDVANEGFEETATLVAESDATELQLAAGGLLAKWDSEPRTFLSPFLALSWKGLACPQRLMTAQRPGFGPHAGN